MAAKNAFGRPLPIAMPETKRLRLIFSTLVILSLLFLLFMWRPPLPNPHDLIAHQSSAIAPLQPQDARFRTVVVARTSEEDVRWVYEKLDGEQNLNIAVYTVDNGSGPFTVPENKGHEVMPYLTYIAEHYHNLSDVTIFLHAHQISWHNNDILDNDAAQMIHHLNVEKVVRDGYVNMRCHLSPGCPQHIHPLTDLDSDGTPEATSIARVWPDLFAPDPPPPIPHTLSQPCCGQFAVSRARLHSLPQSRYLGFRDWLQGTDLSDRISGRIFEYLWQYLFNEGKGEFCPAEHICYCDGFGVCFGGKEKYEGWGAMKNRKVELERVKHEIEERAQRLQDDSQGEGRGRVDLPETEEEIRRLERLMREGKEEALRRGGDWGLRAEEVGMTWKKEEDRAR